MDYYNKGLNEIFRILNSNNNGLTRKEAVKRLEKFGFNEIKEAKKISKTKLFLRQFNSFVVWILVAAVFISLLVNELIDAIVIAAILMTNAGLGFIQEYKAERSIEALKKLTALKAKVIRDNKEIEILTREIVPGDIIVLREGYKIPADSRIIEAFNLATQEAALTGESNPVDKSACNIAKKVDVADRINMLFSSTLVARGKAKAIVTNTGMGTEIGKIAKLMQEIKEEPTPLQSKLQVLGKFLGILTILISVAVFTLGFFRNADLSETLLAAIALAVAAIPEGLPAVVTISLALGIQRMIKRNSLIRTLPSVETLGSTTVICSDKTGTLTMNKMAVKKMFVNSKIVEVNDKFSENIKEFRFLLEIGALCTDVVVNKKIEGDPTEVALVLCAQKAGISKEGLAKRFPKIDEIPFSSERKMMSTLHRAGKNKVAYSKGAPDKLLHLCNKIWINGRVRNLTKKDKDSILKTNDLFAGNALRVLGFAYRYTKNKIVEDDLIFVGLQGMIDPPREEARRAIEKCKQAGIKVVMITGDHKLTAKAIANELGISGDTLTGSELEETKDLEKIVNRIGIYARVDPIQKVKIVEALKKKGHIVAMTGDGVNDAPALKKADIGIAMGISGTDVSKEASDMILVDDNFASIVDAVEEGRGIYDNIKKFVNYLISSNLGEVLVLLIAMIIGFRDLDGSVIIPVLAIQLLWINLITDGLPALALSIDPVDKNIMDKKPRNPKERILSRNMAMNIFVIGILIAAGALFLFKLNINDPIKARTMAFTSLVVFEIFRIQMVRSKYNIGIFSNKYLVGAVILSILLQLLVLYTPLNLIFKTVPLSLLDFSYIFAVSIAIVAIGLIASAIIDKITKQAD